MFVHAQGDVRPPARLGAVVLLLALMPFPVLLWTSDGLRRGLDYETVIFPADAALMMVLAVAGAAVARSLLRRDGPVGTRILALLAAVMAAAWLVHPSGRGLLFVVTLAGAVAVAGATAELLRGPWTRVVAAVVGGLAVLETLWSGAQALLGHGLGLTSLGESSQGVLQVGGPGSGLAPYGSFVHPYVLAGFALVAAGILVMTGIEDKDRSRLWFAAAGVAVMPVGWTYSRAALAGLVMLVACLAVGALRANGRRAYRAALVAL